MCERGRSVAAWRGVEHRANCQEIVTRVLRQRPRDYRSNPQNYGKTAEKPVRHFNHA